MFRDGIVEDLSAIGHRIELDLLAVSVELADDDRLVRGDILSSWRGVSSERRAGERLTSKTIGELDIGRGDSHGSSGEDE
jgi:hypothetical protein